MSEKEAAAVKKDKKHNLMRDIKIDKLVLNCCVGKKTSVAYTILLPLFNKLLYLSIYQRTMKFKIYIII